MQQLNTKRLQNVDALRGFAVVAILLLHNLEHFDVYYVPENLPSSIIKLDKLIWDVIFSLFSGKAYAIFALLFGLTFYIQYKNSESRNFSYFFAWRMVLLFCFGIINSIFFQGDILTIYALIGFFLIPFSRVNTNIVMIIAIILLINPVEVFNLFHAILNPTIVFNDPLSWSYFEKMGDYITGDSFINTVYGNLTNGKLAILHWNIENGRFFNIAAFFLFGMVLGRKNLFMLNQKHKIFWNKALITATMVFIIILILRKNISIFIDSEAVLKSLRILERSWANFAFTIMIVSSFVIIYNKKWGNKVLSVFSNIGRMSLSNYISQSVIGALLYYGFGFGLYKYTGATYSLLIGILVSILMGYFSYWWMKHHKRGPLETIWHNLSWVVQSKK